MFDHFFELIPRVAVLCVGVAHSDAICRLCHCADIERETVGMCLTESPHLISNGLNLNLFFR